MEDPIRRFLMGAAGAAIVLLTACTTTEPSVAQFDLGPPLAGTVPAAHAQLGGATVLADFSAPAWLDNAGIVYRLAYDDASQVRSYAQSRWVAAPASLLAQRLRERLPLVFAPANAVEESKSPMPRVMLHVDLEEFSQVFDAPQTSHVVLRARATLIDSARLEPMVQQAFDVQRPARTPDALGAAHALGEAADQFLTDVLRWMDQAGADHSATAAQR
jgi:cholesterol transport system auxiliary component